MKYLVLVLFFVSSSLYAAEPDDLALQSDFTSFQPNDLSWLSYVPGDIFDLEIEDDEGFSSPLSDLKKSFDESIQSLPQILDEPGLYGDGQISLSINEQIQAGKASQKFRTVKEFSPLFDTDISTISAKKEEQVVQSKKEKKGKKRKRFCDESIDDPFLCFEMQDVSPPEKKKNKKQKKRKLVTSKSDFSIIQTEYKTISHTFMESVFCKQDKYLERARLLFNQAATKKQKFALIAVMATDYYHLGEGQDRKESEMLLTRLGTIANIQKDSSLSSLLHKPESAFPLICGVVHSWLFQEPFSGDYDGLMNELKKQFGLIK